jgi:predicted metal-dependent hydrolase
MREIIELGAAVVALTRKEVKHVHLTVHPPNGNVTMVAPHTTRTDVARAYAITKLGVVLRSAYFLQRMKTKWGSSNPHRRNIRHNTELVKKPKDLLEYVVVHEIAHLLVHSHNARFIAILDRHWPQWHESRAELNALPLAGDSRPA